MEKKFKSFLLFSLFIGCAQSLNILMSRYTGLFPVISFSGGIICWLFFKRGINFSILSSLAGIGAANYFLSHNYLYINVLFSSNNILIPLLIFFILKNFFNFRKIEYSTKFLIYFFIVSSFSSLFLILTESSYLYFILNIPFYHLLTISSGFFLSLFLGIIFFTPFLNFFDYKYIKNINLIENFMIFSCGIILFYLISFLSDDSLISEFIIFLGIPLIIISIFRLTEPLLFLILLISGYMAVFSVISGRGIFYSIDVYHGIIVSQFFFILFYLTIILMKSLIFQKESDSAKIKKLNANLEIKIDKKNEKLKKALKNLKSTKKVYKNIFDNAGDGLFRINSLGEILNINNAAALMFGYSNTCEVLKLKNNNDFNIFHKREDKIKFINLIKNSSKMERFSFEAVKKNMDRFFVQVIASKTEINGSLFTIEGIIRDITNEKIISSELEKKALIDPLTKIYNKDGLYLKIDEYIDSLKRFSLFFLDIDGFKDINDTYGHPIGDEILKIFSKRILKNIRDDDIVARFGGDEFILLIKNMVNHRDITVFSNNLISTLSSPYRLKSGIYKVGVSIGVSIFPDHCASRNELISYADKSMYLSKKNGKNRWTLFKRENYEKT